MFAIEFGDPLLYDVDGAAVLITLLKVVLAFVIGGAVPITGLLLGPRWAEVAPILSLLAVAATLITPDAGTVTITGRCSNR